MENCTNAIDCGHAYIKVTRVGGEILYPSPINPLAQGVAMIDMDVLTKRQKSVYEFIRDKIRNRGYGPTVREIGLQFDISSPNGVMCHLKALEKKGLITREPNMSRAIRLAAEPIDQRGLPLAGRVAAGVMHEAIEQTERDRLRRDVQSQEYVRARGQRRLDDRCPNQRRRLCGDS